ncbi:PH domain-containing protein [Nocardioides lentus]|uniref:PH domain-containing protein n=1 Tax=Nocardioides lentus TaxID=338077 RepID=A0ABP5AQU6_9ACTN
MSDHDREPAPGAEPTAVLREPQNLVSPRAVAYWRVSSGIGTVLAWAAVAVVWFLWSDRPWWATAALVAVAVAVLVPTVVMPPVRYRIHRWDVTRRAVHTRSGWISREERIAPLSRVQTVDSTQGALMRLFGLRSLTVTTASAAGPITIDCLDADVAARLVAHLTEVTGAERGDAT